jgi:hypothetical protein
LKLLEENIRALQDIGIGYNFLNRTLITQEIIARMGKWVCITLKTFTAKEIITRVKR